MHASEVRLDGAGARLEQLESSDNALQREVERRGRLVLASRIQRNDVPMAVYDRRAAATALGPRSSL